MWFNMRGRVCVVSIRGIDTVTLAGEEGLDELEGMLCERDGAVDLITLRCGNKLQDTQSISQLLSKSGRKDGEGRKGWDWYSEGISRIFVAAEKWRCRFLVLLVFPSAVLLSFL
jgi:hypothetical protein